MRKFSSFTADMTIDTASRAMGLGATAPSPEHHDHEHHEYDEHEHEDHEESDEHEEDHEEHHAPIHAQQTSAKTKIETIKHPESGHAMSVSHFKGYSK